MNDDNKKVIEAYLYAIIAYIIVKEILPKIEIKDDNEN